MIDTSKITINSLNITVLVKKSLRAKNLGLRYNIAERCFILTIPKKISEKRAFAFLHKNESWINQKRQEIKEPIFFVSGLKISFFDKFFTINHAPVAKRGVWFEDDKIMVSGNIEELGTRVERFLKKQAQIVFEKKAKELAQKLNIKIAKIKIKDTTSRWGSCSSKSNINFNWRLSLAPLFVSDYVVVHETVHLGIKNHGKDFWNEVKKHCPDYKKAKLWLKQKGNNLFLYGGVEQS